MRRPSLGAIWVHYWKCDSHASTMRLEPGLGPMALDFLGLQCHRIAIPMRGMLAESSFES
jgi:hypothetical protein